MDNDIAGWALEFLLRQPSVDGHTLDDLIRVLPLPDHNPSLKKSLLLRKIESDISKGTVSASILELFEFIHELDRRQGIIQVPKNMKDAYCVVAVHCALKLLGPDVTNKEMFSDVVNTIWKHRAVKMKDFFDMPSAASEMELISEELRSWMCNIKAGVWDMSSCCQNVSIMEYIKHENVVKVVRQYVAEAKEMMGPPFLGSVAEELGDDVMMEVAGGGERQQGRPQRGEGENIVFKRTAKRAWSIEEENALWMGVKKHGVGKWKLILDMYPDKFSGRRAVDLKDKWRNMSRYILP